MARNGATKAGKAAMPNDLYDTLDLAGQGIWDLIGSLGYRPDKTENEEWIALSTKGEDKIGPFVTIAELGEAVQTHVDKADEVLLEADVKGNRYLPGVEEVVDSQIAAAAGKYHAIKTDRVAMTAKEIAAKDELTEICHAKRHLFKADPDNSNSRIYKAGGIVVRISNEWKEKISTETPESSD
jgi:hypothetical protein